MVMKIAKAEFVTLLICMAVCCGTVLVNGDKMEEQCSNEFTKVTACLQFATGKADTPTKECCSAATEIKDNNPACMCYIIQQIHNGTNPQIKSMGIQEPRLLQLPSACKLTNASISDCPKLLHLPANSPEAAIFTNPPNSTTTPPSTPGTSSPTTAAGSNGLKNAAQFAGPIALAMAIFVSAFPSGIWP